jgi:hypothetical protein
MKHYTLGTDVFNFICTSGTVDTRKLVRVFESRGFSKQGVYKALRQLAQDEKILLRPKLATVNYVWLIREIRALSALLPDHALVHETYAKRRVYKMKTLNELDAVYAQIFVSILMAQSEKRSEALFYDLHNYTYLHKVPLVDLYVDLLNKKFEQTCLLVGSESPLDKVLKKKMTIPVHLIPKRWNTFISVIGDYTIYNYVDSRIWSKIDRVFNTMDVSTASTAIRSLAEDRGSYRIVVEKNVEKSEEFRRVFGKYFVLGRKK